MWRDIEYNTRLERYAYKIRPKYLVYEWNHFCRQAWQYSTVRLNLNKTYFKNLPQRTKVT